MTICHSFYILVILVSCQIFLCLRMYCVTRVITKHFFSDQKFFELFANLYFFCRKNYWNNFFSFIFLGFFCVCTEYLCRHLVASTRYCAIPGGYPPQDWQSLPCAGEELGSNPELVFTVDKVEDLDPGFSRVLKVQGLDPGFLLPSSMVFLNIRQKSRYFSFGAFFSHFLSGFKNPYLSPDFCIEFCLFSSFKVF
jgi:hypothetical protein